jgi:hypothetical protein
VPDRLVDLELHLPRVEHERRDLARALLRRQQLDGFGRGPLGLLDQAELLDVLPARGRDVAAERVRERAALELAVAERRGLDPRAGLDRGLLDRRALARGEERLRRNRSIPPSPNASPSIDCIRRVASISIATFSSSGTLNGSTCIGECQVPVTGSTGARTTGSIGRRAAAFAISTASLAVRRSPRARRAVAANPQYPFTSTRIPRPSEVERSIPSISWFRTVIDSESSATTRPSA